MRHLTIRSVLTMLLLCALAAVGHAAGSFKCANDVNVFWADGTAEHCEKFCYGPDGYIAMGCTPL